MEKFNLLLQKIGRALSWLSASDRGAHQFIGNLIFILFSLILPMWIALIIVAVLAITKELIGLKYGGKFDILDIIASIIIPVIMTLSLLIT